MARLNVKHGKSCSPRTKVSSCLNKWSVSKPRAFSQFLCSRIEWLGQVVLGLSSADLFVCLCFTPVCFSVCTSVCACNFLSVQGTLFIFGVYNPWANYFQKTSTWAILPFLSCDPGCHGVYKNTYYFIFCGWKRVFGKHRRSRKCFTMSIARLGAADNQRCQPTFQSRLCVANAIMRANVLEQFNAVYFCSAYISFILYCFFIPVFDVLCNVVTQSVLGLR